MQNKILIYVLGFMGLIALFLTVNFAKKSNSSDKNLSTLKNKIDSLENQNILLDKIFSDQIYFSLKNNPEALAYFGEFEEDSLILFIRDQLYEKNFNDNSNFFIPLSNSNNKYLINKVKILNHKWIIADFSNGSRWGEMWIEYYFKENAIVFDLKEYFLY